MSNDRSNDVQSHLKMLSHSIMCVAATDAPPPEHDSEDFPAITSLGTALDSDPVSHPRFVYDEPP